MNIEDCAEHFNIKNGSGNCGNNCATCPRSRSKNVSAKSDGSYDVVIIGAGCIGAAIARELSRYSLSVLMLESGDDVTQGATKGNSGIVHAGYDDKPGSVRSRFCWPGNQMFPQLDRELHFGYQRNGSLVLARGAEEEKVLEDLLQRGLTNGVKNLRIIHGQELFDMEPHISPDTTAALHAPDAGNLIPYEFAIALAENAVDNGVELRIRREVSAITKNEESGEFTVTAKHWEPRNYIDYMNQQQLGKGQGNFLEKLFTAVSMATAMTMVLTRVILKEAQVLSMYPDLKEMLSHQRPWDVVVSITLIIILTTAIMILKSGSPNSDAGVVATSAPVGEGGSLVSVEEMKVGGSGCSTAMDGKTVAMEEIKCQYVVNAAGCNSDKIAKMIGDDSFQIKPRLGNYILLNRNQGHLAKNTLFPCPHPVLGKGVLVQTTLWGNLILGPTARDTHLPEVMSETNDDIMTYILSKCKALVPSFDPKEVIHTFCGARAKSTRGDWIIEPSATEPNVVHAAGIDSPGLAGSPAIALEVVSLLQKAGLQCSPDPNFNPNRAPIITPKDGWKGIKAGPVGKYTDPKENIVCKCEKVTEAEVVEALHRGLPIDSTQAIRKRTRAGMGHCQAASENYDCECRVTNIIARETGLPADVVGRRPWPATSTLPRRWVDDKIKIEIESLAQ